MKSKKCIFYAIYGPDKEKSGQPYSGGWSVIEAPDMGSATQIFNAIHPCKVKDRPNFQSIYSSDVFGATLIAQQGHNYGHACHEKIIWEVYDDE